MKLNLSKLSTEDYSMFQQVSSLNSKSSVRRIEVKNNQKYFKVNNVRSQLLLQTSDLVNLKVKTDKIRINSELPKEMIKKYDDYVVNVSSGLFHRSSTSKVDKIVNECIKSPRNIDCKYEKFEGIKYSNTKLRANTHSERNYTLCNIINSRRESTQSAIQSSITSFNSSFCLKEDEKKLYTTKSGTDKIAIIKSSFLKLNLLAFKQKQIIDGDPEETTINNILSLSKKWIDLLKKKGSIISHKEQFSSLQRSSTIKSFEKVSMFKANSHLKIKSTLSHCTSTNSISPKKDKGLSRFKKNNTQHNIKQFKCEECLFTISEVKLK